MNFLAEKPKHAQITFLSPEPLEIDNKYLYDVVMDGQKMILSLPLVVHNVVQTTARWNTPLILSKTNNTWSLA